MLNKLGIFFNHLSIFNRTVKSSRMAILRHQRKDMYLFTMQRSDRIVVGEIRGGEALDVR